MNTKMGYILIAIGIAIIVWGVLIISKQKPNEKTEISHQKAEISNKQTEKAEKAEISNNKVEKQEVKNEKPVKEEVKPLEKEKSKEDNYEENKAKGDAFERFVVKNFNKKYFTLQEWRSDKYVDGIYAVSNHFPDLEVIFNLKSKGVSETFAIECKWRKNYYHEAIEWAKDYQLKNYKDYAYKLKIPVFVIIGVGGEAENPNEIFIVPLQKMKSNTISKSELAIYKKELSNSQFFWDYENNKLQ